MTWDTNPKLWDTLVIDNIALAGVWEVEPVNGTVRNVKAKRSKGKDGAKLKDHGLEEANLRLTGRITSGMWEDAKEDIYRLLPPTEGAEQAPHTVSHPMCAAMRIDKIIVRGIKPHPPDRGIMKIEINATKWVKEVSDTKTTEKFRQGVSEVDTQADQYERLGRQYDPPGTHDSEATAQAVDNYLSDPSSTASPFLNQSS